MDILNINSTVIYQSQIKLSSRVNITLVKRTNGPIHPQQLLAVAEPVVSGAVVELVSAADGDRELAALQRSALISEKLNLLITWI